MTAARRPRSATAARMPFVLLIVTLLAGGLISLLLLNAAVNSDSFKLDKLDKETTGYTDEQQALQQEVDQYGAPGSLEQRARELGMVPGGNPAFLGPDGKVHGSPEAATAPPPPPTTPPPTTPPPATPTGTGTPPAKPADAPATNTTAGKPPAGTAPNTNTAAHAPAAGTGQPATAPATTPATPPATTPAR
ncbi:septum formation initiator [Streptomyces sp. CA-111067]|uniref:septum formation initiator n=1 Tax=Streptomyces sp. CA-111067 TaxID=3240046 RepID=UPI003D999856